MENNYSIWENAKQNTPYAYGVTIVIKVKIIKDSSIKHLGLVFDNINDKISNDDIISELNKNIHNDYEIIGAMR